MMKGAKKYFAVFLLIVLLLFVSGQQGCSTFIFPGNTNAGKTGLDYSLSAGTDMLTAGKLLSQGETFYVGVHIENYDLQPKIGEVCIRDNIADTYGGISNEIKGDCKPFSVRAAETVKIQSGLTSKETEEIKPSVIDVYFPENAEYSYNNLPSLMKPYDGSLYVSLKYIQRSKATSTVSFQEGQQVSITQEAAPIIATATKSVHKLQEGYRMNLNIMLAKQSSAKIFSPDFVSENTILFNAELMPQKMSCTLSSGESVLDKVGIENERLIKCSSIVYSAGEVSQSYPLVIALDYGVAIEKQYNFGIKTTETA